MERFYNNEDEDPANESYFGSDDDYDDDDDMDGDVIGFIDQQGILDVMQMDIAQSELNQDLLSKAIEIAKSSWFWSFKNVEQRLNEIELIYHRLVVMTDDLGDNQNEIEG